MYLHLDTVIGKQEIPIEDFKKFSHWPSESRRDKYGEFYRLHYQDVPVGDYATLKLFVERRYGTAKLGFDTSLPKYKYDNNVQMLLPSDLKGIAEGIDGLIMYHTGIEYDALNASLSRADIPHNFKVTQDEVNRRLAASKLATYSRKHTRVFDKEKGVPSVYHGRKGYHEVYLYSKHHEVAVRVKDREANDEHLRNAVGILRLEDARYRDKLRQDAKLLGIADITLATFLNYNIAEEILINDMDKLQLNRPIAGRDQRELQLEFYCGDDKPKWARLWGFLDRVVEHGEKSAFDYFGYAYAHRAKTQLIEAGIWLSAENRIPLPALAAPSFDIATVAPKKRYVSRGSNTSDLITPMQISL